MSVAWCYLLKFQCTDFISRVGDNLYRSSPYHEAEVVNGIERKAALFQFQIATCILWQVQNLSYSFDILAW